MNTIEKLKEQDPEMDVFAEDNDNNCFEVDYVKKESLTGGWGGYYRGCTSGDKEVVLLT